MSFPEKTAMRIGLFVLGMYLTLTLATGWAQSASDQSSGTPSDQSNQPGPPSSSDNPPISGLDQASLESRIPARSFLIPGIHVSEAVDSNLGDTSASSSVQGVTRVMGSVMLQKIGNRFMTALDYIGGGEFYSGFAASSNQVQQLDAEERILWRKGQLTARDQFSYLPEGVFGFGVYGESGAYSQGLAGIGYVGGGIGAGLGGLFGPGQFGSLGQQPRINNLATVDIDQALTPRSAVTLAGGYGIVHFTDNSAGFINSNQVSAEAAYDYQLNRKDQIAFLYGFQDFRYPNFAGSTYTTQLGQVMFGHRVSGRMDLIVGAGPQVTLINVPLFGGSTQKLTVSAQASLRYRFPRTSLGVFYSRFNTSGSGYFLGATSDVVRVSASRPLSRLWTVGTDIGWAHNSQVQPGLLGLLPPTTTSFQYWYAGAVARRELGRHFSFFISYQFNDLLFNSGFCGTSGICNQAAQRHVAAVGLDWHPHPIRLD